MIKYILSLFVVMMTLSTSFAQLRKVPSAVTESFKARYPEAAKVEWKDNLTNFKAEFELNGYKAEAKFDNDGKWEETETTLYVTDLPVEVRNGFNKSKYTDWAITDLYKLEYPDKTHFRVQIKKRSVQKKNLLFSNDGQLISDNITL